MASIMLRYLPSIITLMKVFIIRRSWIFLNASSSIEVIMYLLSFLLLMRLSHSFAYVKPFLWHRNELNFIMVYDIYILLVQSDNILLKIFAFICLKDTDLWLFFIVSLTLFGIACCCFSRVQLFVTLWTVACQAPLSMGFSKQEYCSGLPFPPPRDLSDPGIELTSFISPALAGKYFSTSTTYLVLGWRWFHRMHLDMFSPFKFFCLFVC